MADQTANAPNAASGSTTIGADVADAGNRLDKERQALSDTIGEARDAAVAEARDLGDRAAARIGSEAEGIRDEAAAGLTAFSDALRAASSELSGKKVGFAGDMVQQAAGGLENLARSLEGRSPGEMLESIRAFGRQSPVGFIAGSVLTGFALGRLAAALPTGAGQASGTEAFGSGSYGTSGTGAYGTETSGTGAYGAGTSGTGTSGIGTSGTGTSGTGAASSTEGRGTLAEQGATSGSPAGTQWSGAGR